MRRKHHDLVAWQISVELVGDLYKLTETFPAKETYGLVSQIRRLDRVFGLIGGLLKSIRTTT